jgi:uncharacterized lipoprotein YmbA
MRLSKRRVVLSASTGLFALLAGCTALNRPYPAKRCFALETPQRPERVNPPASATMRVRQFRVSPPYHQPQFVYRLGEAEFKRDYYVEFIAPPSELVTDQAIAWLCDSGAFRTTCAGSSAADHDLVLEAVVTSLYGDYTDATAPQAVLSIHFFLLAEGGTRTNVVFDRTYSEHVSVGGEEPDKLVRGWSQGLQRILTTLEADLRGASLVSVARAQNERNR